MFETYVSLFRAVHRWSAKFEFDGRSSMFRATLYVSALQFINAFTVFFAVQSVFAWRLKVPSIVGPLILLSLFLLNLIFVRVNEALVVDSPGDLPSQVRGRVRAYVSASILLFVVAAVVFVATR